MPVAFFRNRKITRVILIVFAAVVVVFTALVFGLSDSVITRLLLKPGHIIIERRPDVAYEKLFPYYVELCAASQFRAKLTGEGGIAGHAVMYLKGACKEDDAPYPQLRRCRVAATKLDDPEHGAGISVSRWFQECQLGGGSGLRTVFRGQPQTWRTPDPGSVRGGTSQDVIARGVYKGVAFHRYPGASSDTAISERFRRTETGSAPTWRSNSPARCFAPGCR